MGRVHLDRSGSGCCDPQSGVGRQKTVHPRADPPCHACQTLKTSWGATNSGGGLLPLLHSPSCHPTSHHSPLWSSRIMGNLPTSFSGDMWIPIIRRCGSYPGCSFKPTLSMASTQAHTSGGLPACIPPSATSVAPTKCGIFNDSSSCCPAGRQP